MAKSHSRVLIYLDAFKLALADGTESSIECESAAKLHPLARMKHIGRPGVVPVNGALGIANREYVTNEDRSVVLDLDTLTLVTDDHVTMALRLEAEFGLRREEATKFTPARDDRGDRIRLKGSTTKGGRPRRHPRRAKGAHPVQPDALAGQSLTRRRRRATISGRLPERAPSGDAVGRCAADHRIGMDCEVGGPEFRRSRTSRVRRAAGRRA